MSTLCTQKATRGNVLLVCIYVDDLIYMGSSIVMIEEFKKSMNKVFDMSDLGLMSYFLGLEVKQDQNGIHICQKKICRRLIAIL